MIIFVFVNNSYNHLLRMNIILQYLSKYKKESFLVSFLQLLVWGMQTITQLLMIKTFEYAIKLDGKMFFIYTCISILCWASYFYLNFILSKSQGKLIIKLNSHVRNKMLSNLINKGFYEFYSTDTGNYLSSLTTNIKQIETFAWEPFFNGIGRMGQIMWSLIALAYLDWSLIRLAVITLVIMFFVPKFFQNKLEHLGEAFSTILGKSTSKFKEILLAFGVFKSFNKEDLFISLGNRYGQSTEQINYELNITKDKISLFLAFLNVLMQLLSDLLILWLVLKGRLSLAVLVGGSNLISSVSNGFNEVNRSRLSIASCKSYFEDAEDVIINQKREIKDFAIREKIEVKNLTFSYSEKVIFRNLNIVFYIGKKHLILGRSGSGKSTLLKILLGWFDHYDGQILYDGVDLRTIPSSHLNKDIGYIDQNLFLFNDSIKNNITLYDNYDDKEISGSLYESSLNEDIEHMPDGIDTIVGENGNNISEGQKQRVVIARALIHGKSILFVDEGTSSLDKENSLRIEKTLLNNKKLTLVYIAHSITNESLKKFDYIYDLDRMMVKNQ